MFDFPASPALNQVYSSGGASYFWNGYAWEGGGAISPASVTSVSDTPPANPLPGQLWWESDTGYLFTSYTDANTTQWVQINALQANAVLKTGDTMSGALTVNNTLTVKGGTAGGYGRIAIDDAGGSFNSALGFWHNGVIGWDITQGSDPKYLSISNSANPTTANLNITSTTASSSPTTGALTVAGGVGISGTLWGKVAAFGNNGAAALYADNNDATATSQASVTFRRGAALSTVGGISTTNVATAYNTSSDTRLKEDLQYFDAGRIIDDTEVYDFKWKNVDERAYGIVAQQAVEVYPQAIFHDETSDWWGVDYSKYVPVLLQELKAVRARLAELEAVVPPKKGR
jgi:hypothetical protein